MLENYLFDFDGTIADSGETGIIAVQKAFVEWVFQLKHSSLKYLIVS